MMETIQVNHEVIPHQGIVSTPEKRNAMVVSNDNRGMQVGFCVVTETFTHTRILGLYVNPAARRRGVAKRLLEFVFETFPKRDVYVECDAFEFFHAKAQPIDEVNLRKFYLKIGFEPVVEHPFALVRKAKKQERSN